jgi:CHAD domain-containing protein
MTLSVRWMVTDGPHALASVVAGRIVRHRLAAVWELLGRVAEERSLRSEDVHQLRVATRRSLVAIELFADLVDSRETEWFERQLRRIRRTAGEARDLDVLIERLGRDLSSAKPAAAAGGRSASAAEARERKRPQRLLAMLGRQRQSSRRPIRLLHGKLVDNDWPQRVDRLVEPLSSGGKREFGKHARRRLAPVMRRFFRTADRRHRDAEDLHELRIEGKKLRYALEICGVVFDARQRSRCLEAIEELQERLGDFTDHAAAADRFGRWRRQKAARVCRDELSKLHRRESKLADEARRAFTKWWTHRRRRELCRRFERSLGRE